MNHCKEYEVLITGYIDGELEPDQLLELKNHLNTCESCRKEVERAKMFKETLDMMTIRTPEDDFWDGYWAGIYNRLERRTAWLVFVIGVLILSTGGLILLLKDVLFAENTPLWVSVGGSVTVAGTAALFVSLLRERLRVNRNERYKDVRR